MTILGIINRSSVFLVRNFSSGRGFAVRRGDLGFVHTQSAVCPLAVPLERRHFSSSPDLWAGHSHWKNIKHIKGANDAKKATIVTRIARDIRTAVKLHGSANPRDNAELARIIQYAKNENVPGEMVERTLAAIVANKNKPMEMITYECKGPAGSLMLLEIATANRNRTRQELNAIFKRHVASILDGGGILHSFDRKSMVTAKHPKEDVVDLSKAEETAIEVGAEEVLSGDFPGEVVFVADPMDASKVAKALEKLGYTVTDNVAEYIPKIIVELSKEATDELNGLKSKLEEHPDFSNIYMNCAI